MTFPAAPTTTTPNTANTPAERPADADDARRREQTLVLVGVSVGLALAGLMAAFIR